MNIENQSIESVATSIPIVQSNEPANDDADITTNKSAMNANEPICSSQLSIVQSANNDDNMRLSSSADDDLYTSRQDNGNADRTEHNDSLSATLSVNDDGTNTSPSTDTQQPHEEEVYTPRQG